jgi:hypothetical protein
MRTGRFTQHFRLADRSMLATGRLAETRDILLAWSTALSLGTAAGRFPDHGGQVGFNAHLPS